MCSYLNNKKYDYAMTLCLFASQIVEELGESQKDLSLFDDKQEEFVDLSASADLSQEIELLNCRIKAEAYYEQTKKKESKVQTMASDLNAPVPFNANGKYDVISIPVPMHSVTCKPLFFDLYADQVDYPSMESRIQTEVKKEEKKGWFSGWW